MPDFSEVQALLGDAAQRAGRYLAGLDERRVAPDDAALAGLARFDEPLPETSGDPAATLALLDEAGSSATVASAGGRYFGFVIFGSFPVAVAAAWLATAWDQDVALPVMSPVGARLHDVVTAWLADLLGLPAGTASVFVFGASMANTTALAAARDYQLARAGPLDARVRDLIVAETRGNPLALLELPRGLTPAELAGGFGLPVVTPLTSRIEDSFARQVEALPVQARRLLQLAAADPSGDRSLLWRAAERLGLGFQAGRLEVEAGLVEFDGRVRFRHPLTRSAAYRSASQAERQELHAALDAATDPQDDLDRRAWHLAQATFDYDEEVAAELERSAGRVQAQGGVAASAAFLERVALLTGDPTRRAGRALTAAQAKVQAGAAGAAQDLLAIARAAPLGHLEQARMQLVEARLASATR